MNAWNLEVLVFEERKGKREFSEKTETVTRRKNPNLHNILYIAVHTFLMVLLNAEKLFPNQSTHLSFVMFSIIPMNLGPVI